MERIIVEKNHWPMPAGLILTGMGKRSEADIYNSEVGNLRDYDCRVCLNKGFVGVMYDEQMIVRRCSCYEPRKAIGMMRKAGVDADKTFDNYKAKEPWQREILRVARDFVGAKGSWMYAGGQVGAGKTHICTAIVNEFINRGYQCVYMLWKDSSTKLKACITEGDKYSEMLERFKTAQVLYIDDFLKTRPNEVPSAGDLNLAFELINYRYNNKELITVISSERLIAEISLMDEAVGSRIFERSRDYCVNIGRNEKRNYRLSGEL